MLNKDVVFDDWAINIIKQVHKNDQSVDIKIVRR